MVSQIVGTADQRFHIDTSTGRIRDASSGEYRRKEFKLFGDDGFTFRDFLDMINPLQHIPVVGTIYRAITGDELDPGPKMFGSTVLGGPIGAAFAVIDVAIKHNTGLDMGEHVVATFTGNEGAPGNPNPGNPNQEPTEVASAGIGAVSAATQPVIANGFQALPAEAAIAPGPDSGAAGMSAIPQISQDARTGYLERTAAYMPKTAPDLGTLADKSAVNAQMLAAIESPSAADAQPARRNTGPRTAANKPLALDPLYSIDEKPTLPSDSHQAFSRQASISGQLAAAEQALNDSKNGWIAQAMIKAMDKYETGRRLGDPLARPDNSVLR